MRLIDIDRVINAMQVCIDEDHENKAPIARYAFEQIINLLKREPTVDSEPVIHARWERLPLHYPLVHRCSHCGEIGDHKTPKFCPECGAKMDLKAEEIV